jgi:hypothetical protein
MFHNTYYETLKEKQGGRGAFSVQQDGGKRQKRDESHKSRGHCPPPV